MSLKILPIITSKLWLSKLSKNAGDPSKALKANISFLMQFWSSFSRKKTKFPQIASLQKNPLIPRGIIKPGFFFFPLPFSTINNLTSPDCSLWRKTFKNVSVHFPMWFGVKMSCVPWRKKKKKPAFSILRISDYGRWESLEGQMRDSWPCSFCKSPSAKSYIQYPRFPKSSL